MAYDMKKWFSELTGKGHVCSLPVMSYPALEIIGRKVIEAVTDGEVQFECMKVLAERYPTAAAAVSFMDLSVEAEAFGGNVKFSENEVPAITGRIVTDMNSAEKLTVPAVGKARTAECIKAIELASAEITDRPVLAGQIGPFSLAGRLMDMTEIMYAIMEEPEMVHVVLEKCTQFLIQFAKALKEAGANGVLIAEPASGLLSPEKCEEFSTKYVTKIVQAVQDDSFAVILHNCGKTVKLVQTMLSTGAIGFHFGNAVKMSEIIPQIPEDRLVFGNIDPAGVFKNGTVESITAETKALLEDMKPYRNFIISSGCDIPPESPLEILDTFFRIVGEYNNKLAQD